LDLLLHHGIRVRYAPDAVVLGQMPVTSAQGESQRARWEGGRYRLMARRVPSLVRAAAGRRDPKILWSALDLSALPLAEVTVAWILWASLSVAGWLWASKSIFSISASACAMVGLLLIVYVVVGLRIAGATSTTYRALLRVPVYILWKLALYARGILIGGKRTRVPPGSDAEWVRTERIPMDDDLDKRQAGGTR